MSFDSDLEGMTCDHPVPALELQLSSHDWLVDLADGDDK